MPKENCTYQDCLSRYSIWIKSNIDGDQRDYYKECTHMAIWYHRNFGSRIQIVFFKDNSDYKYILENKTFAWRVDVHYWGCNLYNYPINPTREWIIDFIIRSLMDIYKDGDIPHSYNR